MSGVAQPGVDAVAVFFESDRDGMFRGCPIVPGRCCGDVPLFPKPVAEWFVGLPEVYSQGVPARAFILRKIPRGADGGSRLGISCTYNGVRRGWL